MKSLSYGSSVVWAIVVGFVVYTGFVWVLSVFPIFFVVCGIAVFGCSVGCFCWMMINKTRAIYRVDTNGVKQVASRARRSEPKS